MNPLVSVIIPAFNAAETITACVQSVLEQTYNNIEIIVIDDGSKDNTRQILEKHKIKFDIENLYILHQKNAGPSSARNLGIELARGVYIAFLDADDRWDMEKIDKQIHCLQRNKAALIGCQCRIGNFKRNVFSSKKERVITFAKLLYHNYFNTPSIVVLSDVVRKNKFNVNQRYSEDYRLWLEVARRYKCIYLDECLVQLYDKPIFGGSGLSGNLWKMEKGELSNYKYFYSEHYISVMEFFFCCAVSLIKYVRRYILSYLFKISNAKKNIIRR